MWCTKINESKILEEIIKFVEVVVEGGEMSHKN